MARFAHRYVPLLGFRDYPWGSNPVAFSFNNSGGYLALPMQWPRGLASNEITHVGYKQNSVTGTSPNYIMGLEGISGTDGTPDASALRSTAAFQPTSGDNAKFVWRALSSSYTATVGQFFMGVIRYSSGTIDGSNFVQFHAAQSNTIMGFPYYVTHNGTSATKAGGMPLFGCKTAGGDVFGWPIGASAQTNINGGGVATSEAGMAFALPATLYPTYKIAGVRVWTNGAPASANLSARLYTGTTLLQECTRDSDWFSLVPGAIEFWFTDSSLTTLTGGTTYRIVVHNSHASTNWGVGALTLSDAGDRDAFPFGTSVNGTTRVGSGSWTDTTTTFYPFGLILEETAVSAGGASSLIGSGLVR